LERAANVPGEGRAPDRCQRSPTIKMIAATRLIRHPWIAAISCSTEVHWQSEGRQKARVDLHFAKSMEHGSSPTTYLVGHLEPTTKVLWNIRTKRD